MNAEKIRDLCKRHRVSLKELSKKIGLTPTGLQHILKQNATNTGTLERISHELGVHPGYFFDDFPLKSDKYNVVSNAPPIVTESYPEMSGPARQVMRDSSDVYRQLSELQAEKIKLQEEIIKMLREKTGG